MGGELALGPPIGPKRLLSGAQTVAPATSLHDSVMGLPKLTLAGLVSIRAGELVCSLRIEEADLYVVPVFLVHRTIPLKAVVQELRLPAQLVIRQVVRMIRTRYDELIDEVRAGDFFRAALAIEAARAKPLRPREVGHDIRRNMPGQIGAAFEAGLRVPEVFLIEVDRVIDAPAGRHTLLEAVEAAGHAADEGVLEFEVPRTRRQGEHFRNQVKVDVREERSLFDLAMGVFKKGDVVVLDTGVFDGGAGDRADIRHATRIARRSRRAVRRAIRDGLVQPVGLVTQ